MSLWCRLGILLFLRVPTCRFVVMGYMDQKTFLDKIIEEVIPCTLIMTDDLMSLKR